MVTPAQALLAVVPDNERLSVEASVDNKDVGFIRVGQRAEIKVATFAFTRYGMIDGRVTTLSHDALFHPEDAAAPADREKPPRDDDSKPPSGGAYMARIALDRSIIQTEAGPMPLGPGMAVTAEIYTGRRSIISFLLSPLQRVTEESLHER